MDSSDRDFRTCHLKKGAQDEVCTQESLLKLLFDESRTPGGVCVCVFSSGSAADKRNNLIGLRENCQK